MEQKEDSLVVSLSYTIVRVGLKSCLMTSGNRIDAINFDTMLNKKVHHKYKLLNIEKMSMKNTIQFIVADSGKEVRVSRQFPATLDEVWRA